MPKRILFVLITAALTIASLPPVVPQAPAPVQAQDATTCPEVIENASTAFVESCGALSAGEGCVSEGGVSLEFQTTDSPATGTGARFNIDTLASISTTAADPETGDYGMAAFSIRADLPEDAEGAMQIVVFGGAEVRPAASALPIDNPARCTATNERTDNINIRTGPGTQFSVIDSLKPNDSLEFYGRSSGGDWIISNRGWLYAPLLAIDCELTAVEVVASTEARYMGAMQNIQLTIPDKADQPCTGTAGIFIQVPAEQIGNILVNHVEIRAGSTVFITMNDDNTIMSVINLEGDVSTIADNVLQRVPPGSAVDIPVEAADDGDLYPAARAAVPVPFDGNTAIPALTPLLEDALPDAIDIPEAAIFTTPSVTVDTDVEVNPGEATGTWLPCGSCDSCGYPATECVTSPTGECLWDPATCRDLPPAPPPGVPPSITFTAMDLTCTVGQTITLSATLNNAPASLTIGSPSVTAINGNVIVFTPVVTGTQVVATASCDNDGMETIQFSVTDSTGTTWTTDAKVTVNP